MRPIRQFLKEHSNAIEYVGIAIDEQKRLKALKQRKGNKISLLEQFNYTEQMALELCKRYNLLSPIYSKGKNTRGGCWNCLNQSLSELKYLRKNYPDLWNLMLKWDNDSPTSFKIDKTLHDLERRFELEDMQISIFD